MTQIPSQPLALGTDMNHAMGTSQQRGRRETGPHMVFSGGSSLAQSQMALTGNCILRLTAENSSFTWHEKGSWLARHEQHSADDGLTLRCPISSVAGINVDLHWWLHGLFSGRPHVPGAPAQGTTGVPGLQWAAGAPATLAVGCSSPERCSSTAQFTYRRKQGDGHHLTPSLPAHCGKKCWHFCF